MNGLLQRAKARLSSSRSANNYNDKQHQQPRHSSSSSSSFSFNTSQEEEEKEEKKSSSPPVSIPSSIPSSPPPPAYSRHSNENNTIPTPSSTPQDPYHFLYLFDTVFLVDDSSSMCGLRWRQVQRALQQLTPVCTSHDDDGIDVYFMNHRNDAHPSQGYTCIRQGAQVESLFRAVRPLGPTPTGPSIERILDPYFERLSSEVEGRGGDFADVRPLNLIVLTDGMPGPSTSYLPEKAIVRYATRLDEMAAPSYQVGIQFIQVGDDAEATLCLERLDRLRRRYRIRDIVDTTKFSGPLSAEGILKAVLG
ncbi:hypothetical protein CP532_1263 [Ophiocordyceps camponoti-leonardi (nom. inval.)]|nr:hypothetical protein CP532_1263 [Ophiocordyceps camponoti-leonardi (nom. inval.)]